VSAAARAAGARAASPAATPERGVARPQGPACDIGAVEVKLAHLRSRTPERRLMPAEIAGLA